MRTLLSGKEVPEYEQATTLSIVTKCPAKWKLIDMETGEEYIPWETPGPQQWQKVVQRKENIV